MLALRNQLPELPEFAGMFLELTYCKTLSISHLRYGSGQQESMVSAGIYRNQKVLRIQESGNIRQSSNYAKSRISA